ncbi:catalase-like [Leptidea sinapis]|uniref:catalase-like n=1 Tax=Leptidea sinapis TaxID=189913 RepID=UPI0021C4847B|nr:catalase-like [Leptidea sinapis]
MCIKTRHIQLFIFITLASIVKSYNQQDLDPVNDQIVIYSLQTKGNITIATTSNGEPVDIRYTSTLNKELLNNHFFLETNTHLNRKNIPLRFVHTRGSGAFGYFEVTHDITNICRADFLDTIGKRTPIAVRFSPVFGSADTNRFPHGFAVKFYTESGNFDLVGFDTPVFIIKDPVKFPSFIRATSRNPATNTFDSNMLWDFITLNPESINIFMYVFGDSGIPKGYRHMTGYGIHTFQVHNKEGEVHFIRFHIIPNAGRKYFTSKEGQQLDGEDPDSFTRDLYDAIACGKEVSWKIAVQILTLEDLKKANIDISDVTLKLPLDIYPLQPVGKIVLNRNPINYFAEIEQFAFCPSNLVRGIDGGIDKLFQARRFLYEDAQYYRLGVNKNNIEVNYPRNAKVHAYNRDGEAPVRANERNSPNYYINSFNGAMFSFETDRPDLVQAVQTPPNNTAQIAQTFKDMSMEEQERLIDNIVSSLSPSIDFIQNRAVKIFTEINPDFGERVQSGLQNSNKTKACSGILS